jgi:hypothetical protein
MKTCLKCETPFKPRRSDGKYCSKRCSAAASTARYAARQPVEVRAQWRKYFYTERGTVTALLNNSSDRAKRAGLPYDLDREWLTEKLKPMICEMSGLPLERSARGKFRINPFAPSLDRIEPKLGYVKTNVRVIAFIVNRSRSDFGDDILMQMVRALARKATLTN